MLTEHKRKIMIKIKQVNCEIKLQSYGTNQEFHTRPRKRRTREKRFLFYWLLGVLETMTQAEDRKINLYFR